MATFIHLTSCTPTILGKVRINIDNIQMYWPVGTSTQIAFIGGGDKVKESIDKVEALIEQAGGQVFKPMVLS